MIRKWLSLVLALCMMAMVLPVMAEAPAATETAAEVETATETATEEETTTPIAVADLLGAWELYGMVEKNQVYDAETVSSLMGDYALVIIDDGTALMSVNQQGQYQTMEGTWVATAEGIAITINNQTQNASLQDGVLYLEAGEELYMLFAPIAYPEESTEGAGLAGLLGKLLGDSESGEGGLSGLLSRLMGDSESGEGGLSGLLGRLTGGSESGEGGLSGLLSGLLGGSENGEDSSLMSLLGTLLGRAKEAGKGFLTSILAKLTGLLGSVKESAAGLLSTLSGLFSGEDGESGTGLMSLLGGLLGSSDTEDARILTEGETATEATEKAAEEATKEEIQNFFSALLKEVGGDIVAENTYTDYVAAESVESFYGTWNGIQIILAGQAIKLADLVEPGKSLSSDLIVSENKMVIRNTDGITTEETETIVKMELVDGVLVVTEESGDVTRLHLTKDGALVAEEEIASMVYLPAKAE